MNMSPREKRLYDVLADACKRGERCPTNKELGELVGLSSRTIVDVLGHLVNGGQIEINTYSNWRMVKVAGRSSAIPPSHFKRNPFKKSGGAPVADPVLRTPANDPLLTRLFAAHPDGYQDGPVKQVRRVQYAKEYSFSLIGSSL